MFEVSCGVPVFLTSTVGGIGLQYMWMCSNSGGVGYVTLVSLYSSQPQIVQSFEGEIIPTAVCYLISVYVCLPPPMPSNSNLLLRWFLYFIFQHISVCESDIERVAVVSSNIHPSLDHVWMASSANQIHVRSLKVDERMTDYRTISVPCQVTDMVCYGNHVFVALANGCLLKYAKRKGK